MHWCVSVGEFINGNPLLINACSRSSTVASCGDGGSSFSSFYLLVLQYYYSSTYTLPIFLARPVMHWNYLVTAKTDWTWPAPLSFVVVIILAREEECCLFFVPLLQEYLLYSVRASAHLSQFLAAKSTSSLLLLLCWCYCLQHWTVVVVVVLFNIHTAE